MIFFLCLEGSYSKPEAVPVPRRAYLCKLFLLEAVWLTSTNKYFTFFDHFCGFGLIFGSQQGLGWWWNYYHAMKPIIWLPSP